MAEHLSNLQIENFIARRLLPEDSETELFEAYEFLRRLEQAFILFTVCIF